MKFSLASFLSLLVAAGARADATAVAPASSLTLAEDDGDQGWTDHFYHLRVAFRGTTSNPSSADLAFLVQALKSSYNIIHAPLADDFIFVNFNISAVEIEPDTFDKEEDEDELEWLTAGSDSAAGDSVATRRRLRVGAYGLTDFTCRLCGNGDRARSSSTATTPLVRGSSPFDNIKPIQDLLCATLKKKGNRKVYGQVSGCKIFLIDPLGKWDYNNDNTDEEQDTKTIGNDDVHASEVSVALTGLSCGDKEHDFASCQDDVLRQLVSDAFVIAYNQVNFGAGHYFIEDFVPTSFELYREQITAPAAVAGSSTLRGTSISTSSSSTIPGAVNGPTGKLNGSVRIQCRGECKELGDEEENPAMVPFYNLKKVESVFCGLLSDANANGQSDALTTLKDCSLSVTQMVEPENVAEPTIEIENE